MEPDETTNQSPSIRDQVKLDVAELVPDETSYPVTGSKLKLDVPEMGPDETSYPVSGTS